MFRYHSMGFRVQKSFLVSVALCLCASWSESAGDSDSPALTDSTGRGQNGETPLLVRRSALDFSLSELDKLREAKPFADSLPSLQYAGSTLWNTFVDVVVQGGLAYCSMGPGLAILDVSNPALPVWLSQLYLQGQSRRDVELRDGLVYISNGTSGFSIVDVHDPTRPALLGSHRTYDWAKDLELSGNYLYVADFGRLLVFDISNPGHPLQVALGSPTIWGARALAIYGEYLYVAGGVQGLHVVSISDPTEPVLLQTFPGDPFSNVVEEVEVSDGRLFVANNTWHLSIWDLSNPGAIIKVDTVDLSADMFDIEVVDSVLFGIADGKLFISGTAPPPVPGKPQVMWDSLFEHSSGSFALTDRYIFVADGMRGLKIVSHQDTLAMPHLVGKFVGSEALDGVTMAGDLAILRDRSWWPPYLCRLHLVDLSHPATPMALGTFHASGYVGATVAHGHFVYLANSAAGLEVVDIGDPRNPRSIGWFDSDVALDLAEANGHLFAGEQQGLKVFSLEHPEAPELVTNLTGLGRVFSLAAAGNFVYLVSDSVRFQVLDVRAPQTPVVVGGYDCGPMFIGDLHGNYAYLLSNPYLDIVDITDPTSPAAVGRYYTGMRGQSVKVVGQYAYVAEVYLATQEISAVRILDIVDPTQPVAVGTYLTPGRAFDLAFVPGHLVVADWYDCLSLLLGFSRGDINGDGLVSAADVVYLAQYLFGGGSAPVTRLDAGDIDCNGEVDLVDAVFLVNYLFRNGPSPC